MTTTPGWRAGTGPLKTLVDLGLIRNPAQPINWLRSPVTVETRNGIGWGFAPVFLRNEAIRALAALSLEGFEVYIDPNGTNQLLHVSIRENGRHQPK